jgi:mono/diheme cytochrome c family protein
MKREFLARLFVILLIAIAVAFPFAGRWLSSRENTIELHARMPESGGWSMETIEAVVGQPVHLRLTSDDVVHGFAIGKSDHPPLVIQPGAFIETTLTFDRPGKYIFYCDRWCGPNHWRMRGTIEVTGVGQPLPPDPQPLFLKLGIDLDAPHSAGVTPPSLPSPVRGAQFANFLPAYALDRNIYLTSSPAQLWQSLRSDPLLAQQSDSDLWDAVAWVWQEQTTPEKLSEAQRLFATNCAACHGETGRGDGVMVRGLPEIDYQTMGHGLVRPPDFTDPRRLLGASPALLQGKMIRGGMGTGMPYWGPIFTDEQLDALVSYIYTFGFKSNSGAQSPESGPDTH